MLRQYNIKYLQLKAIGLPQKKNIHIIQNQYRHKFVSKRLNIRAFSLAQKLQMRDILDQLIRRDSSPFVINIYEYFVSEDEIILIQQFCEEEDLTSYMQRILNAQSKFSQSMVVNWLIQLIFGMMKLISYGIVLTDFKTSDILVTSNNTIKIGDIFVKRIHNNILNNIQSKQVVGESSKIIKSINLTIASLIEQICTYDTSQKSNIGQYQQTQQKLKQSKALQKLSQLYSSDLIDIIKKLKQQSSQRLDTINMILQTQFIKQSMKRILQNGNKCQVLSSRFASTGSNFCQLSRNEQQNYQSSSSKKCKTQAENQKPSKFLQKFKQRLNRLNVSSLVTDSQRIRVDQEESKIEKESFSTCTQTPSTPTRSSSIKVAQVFDVSLKQEYIKSCKSLVGEKQFSFTCGFIKQFKKGNRSEKQICYFLNRKYGRSNKNYVKMMEQLIPHL